MGEIFRQERSAAALSEAADDRIGRLHRYYLARQMAAGRDVIDLRGGDGSGAAVLAQVARQVTAAVTVPVAFAAANLHCVTPAQIAGDETFSADLVVVFGLLARQGDPAGFIAGLRRLVRQGGRLLLDTAAAAADARQSLSGADLAALLAPGFAHCRVFAQQSLIGSAMLAGDRAATTVFTHRGHTQVEVTNGLGRPDSLLVIAGDTPLDDLTDSLFIETGTAALAEAQARTVQARDELALLRQDHAALAALTAERGRSDAQWRHQLASLRVDAAAATAAATAAEAERDNFSRATLATIARLHDLEIAAQQRAAAFEAECAALRAAQPRGLRARLRRLGLSRLRPRRDSGRIAAIRASAAFDADWYCARYPDVAAAGADPARHYVRNGAAEARDPGPGFDAGWYAAQHAELADSGLTAVEHYERHGRGAGWPTQAPAAPAIAQQNPKILFVAGEPGTPGAEYRCVRYAEAATASGWSAGWSRIDQTGAIDLIGVEIAILWRVNWSKHVEGVMREIHQQGGTVVFDVDDLMVRPELAKTSIIDGIRTTNAGIGSTREFMAQVQQAMLRADLCSTTTEELAAHMRAFQKGTFVLPNGYDAATLAASRLAVRRRMLAPSDDIIRIGYAAGTLTHQKDFAVALPGLLRVLATRPQVRLVLFRARGGVDMVVVEEFEALVAYADRIEFRDKVALENLPAEIARFDINIAPLEVGNPFCEAKSELKYFEASLVSVPTVASPTGPFTRAIHDGVTGLLAADDEAWQQALLRLVDDAGFRRAVGRRAYLDCIFPFGPQRRAELADSFLHQVKGGAAGARAFALGNQPPPAPAPIDLTPATLLHLTDRLGQAQVTVIIPCYNYADYIIEALESVRAQTLELLDLVVVDDCSTDPLTVETILEWVKAHDARFNRLIVVRHAHNAGLSAARNTGFEAAETPFVLPLDADNRLRPAACETLLAALDGARAAYAYPSLQMFGAADSVFCNEPYRPTRMIGGNYIDAMALIAKWAWAAAGGYTMPRSMGWEDYDLWCSLAERGQYGIHVDHILADYRVHGGSMVSNLVEIDVNKEKMVDEAERRHPWLRLSSRKAHERV